MTVARSLYVEIMTSAQYQVLDESQPMEDLNKTNDLEITTTEYFEVERKRGVYRLSVLQLIIRSLILIRACSVLVALASFILITYSVATFKQADNAGRVRDENGQKVSVKTQPAVTFSGIGGASFFLSLLILLGCWKSKKVGRRPAERMLRSLLIPFQMRTINVLTNAVFAVIGCVGFAAWMGGCFYLGRSSLASVPLWYAMALDLDQSPMDSPRN
jgi:hypothetical protein